MAIQQNNGIEVTGISEQLQKLSTPAARSAGFTSTLRGLLTQAGAMLDLKMTEIARHEAEIKSLREEIAELEDLVAFSRGEATIKRAPGSTRRQMSRLSYKNEVVALVKAHAETWFTAEQLLALVGIDPTPVECKRLYKFLHYIARTYGMVHTNGGEFRWNCAYVGDAKFSLSGRWANRGTSEAEV